MKKSYTLPGVFAVFLAAVFIIAGCSNNTVTTPTTKANPNVKSFDSVYVAENVDSTSFSGMDLLTGKTVLRDAPTKDCQLVDNNAFPPANFYLRSGSMSFRGSMVGTQTRFQRMYTDMTMAQFDTISVFNVGHDPVVPNDFTSDDTSPWGYFDTLTTHPVFCVWLKGKHDNGTTGFNDYVIIQPISFTNGGALGITHMVFRARVNIAGQNDFRTQIPN